MDFSKLSANQQITVGAAATMVVVSFFPWYGTAGVIGFNAWRSGLAGPLAVVMLAAAAAVLLMEARDQAPVDSPAAVALYLTLASAVFVLWRVLFTEGEPRRMGLFLAAAAVGVACWAAYQNHLDNS